MILILSFFLLQELTDNEYDVSIRACKLDRQVEMYQWIEHQSKRYLISFSL